MEIGGKVMATGKKEKGRKWDGKSRVSNDLYRKRFNEIFGEEPWVEPQVPKDPTLSEMLEEGFKKEQEELKDDE